MIDIEDYMKMSKSERQRHLNLSDPCVERGGVSFYFKGLLAYILDTTIPSGHKIHLCHACHNGKCGNPSHLYWGTPQENKIDATENGQPSIWERLVAKYGIEEARKRQSRKNASRGGKANKGKPKGEEHKRNISLALRREKDL